MDIFQKLTSSNLRIYPPPDLRAKPWLGQIDPATISIIPGLDFHFTQEATRRLIRTVFGSDAEDRDLYSLTSQELLKYLASLPEQKGLDFAGVKDDQVMRAFLRNIKGDPIGVEIEVDGSLLPAFMD